MKAMTLLMLTLLTGCATTERVVEVKVAVPVGCQVAEPERPAMPTDDLSLDAPVDVMTRHLRAEVMVLHGYADRLVTALRGCRAQP